MHLKNKVVMAAAGSGKTWGICHEVIGEKSVCNKRMLIVTYTNKGVESIRNEYQKQNMGVIDSHVDIKTWYQFLLSDLIKPYQRSIVKTDNRIRSLDFSQSYGKINFYKRGEVGHYLNKNNDVLSNAASELAVDCNAATGGKVISRLSEVYEAIYIDEVQDITGEDFTILELLLESSIKITCVGDYKQATYTTHNAKKMKKATGLRIIDYFTKLENQGKITLVYINETRRFNKKICSFSNTVFSDQNDDSNVHSAILDVSAHEGVYIIHRDDIDEYMTIFQPTVLRFDKRTDTCGYQAYNFGQCKGMTFEHVLIFPNKPLLDFLKKGVALSSPCKYYVAVTRARHSVAFVDKALFVNENFQQCHIVASGNEIRAAVFAHRHLNQT